MGKEKLRKWVHCPACTPAGRSGDVCHGEEVVAVSSCGMCNNEGGWWQDDDGGGSSPRCAADAVGLVSDYPMMARALESIFMDPGVQFMSFQSGSFRLDAFGQVIEGGLWDVLEEYAESLDGS